jgi:hypothetical protein
LALITDQLLVRIPKGGNKPTSLLHNTLVFDLRLELPQKEDISLLDGLRVMSLPAALIACPPSSFTSQALEIRSALSMISEPSELLRKLLDIQFTKAIHLGSSQAFFLGIVRFHPT